MKHQCGNKVLREGFRVAQTHRRRGGVAGGKGSLFQLRPSDMKQKPA